MLPRENLVTQLPSGRGALRKPLRRCSQLSDRFDPEPQRSAWRGNYWFDLRGNGGWDPKEWRLIHAEKHIFRQ